MREKLEFLSRFLGGKEFLHRELDLVLDRENWHKINEIKTSRIGTKRAHIILRASKLIGNPSSGQRIAQEREQKIRLVPDELCIQWMDNILFVFPCTWGGWLTPKHFGLGTLQGA